MRYVLQMINYKLKYNSFWRPHVEFNIAGRWNIERETNEWKLDNASFFKFLSRGKKAIDRIVRYDPIRSITIIDSVVKVASVNCHCEYNIARNVYIVYISLSPSKNQYIICKFYLCFPCFYGIRNWNIFTFEIESDIRRSSIYKTIQDWTER